jgi:hypothetical protein
MLEAIVGAIIVIGIALLAAFQGLALASLNKEDEQVTHPSMAKTGHAIKRKIHNVSARGAGKQTAIWS